MATTEVPTPPSDRRRKPFSSWMRRLTNLKGSSNDQSSQGSSKRSGLPSSLRTKKNNNTKNNPYPMTNNPKNKGTSQANPTAGASANTHPSFYTPPSGRSVSFGSPTRSHQSLQASGDGHQPPMADNKSVAPTLNTIPDTINSDAAHSKAGTSATAGGALSTSCRDGGEGSTFSSPNHSMHSLTTTLTTIQSTAPSNIMMAATNTAPSAGPVHPQPHHHGHNQSVHFSHQFPSSPPASAIPSHVIHQTSGGHPATYNTATANNLLTDNASIMTLASSSKRRRRNSLDTNASMRALAPSSLFGGSRESLPLSVLSGNVSDTTSSGLHQSRPTASAGFANAERASVYSSSGIAPALSSERNSYYAGKQPLAGDGGSIRSGLVGHGRNDSITGSIGGLAGASSPFTSPRELPMQGEEVAAQELPVVKVMTHSYQPTEIEAS